MTAAKIAAEGYAQVRGGRVWYQVVGDGPGTPLAVVHGGPGGTHDYLEPLEGLAGDRPVLFYDQLGAGKSDPADDESLWTNARLIEELGQVLDTVGLQEVHILGQSWGTLVAAEYALTFPQRVKALVLADPCLSLPLFAAGTNGLRAAIPDELRATLDRHEAAGTTDSEEYQAATMEFYGRHLCRLDPWPESLMRTFNSLNLAIYEAMQGPSEFVISGTHKDYDLTGRLGELRAPTLFLCGRYDETRPEETRLYHSLVPDAEMVVFEESSHMPHLEETERYLQVVGDFLRRHDG